MSYFAYVTVACVYVSQSLVVATYLQESSPAVWASVGDQTIHTNGRKHGNLNLLVDLIFSELKLCFYVQK